MPKGYEEHNMLPKELRGGPATPRGQEYLGPTENEGRQRAVREYIERQLMQRGIDPNTPLDPAPQHMQQQPQRPQIRNDPPPGISQQQSIQPPNDRPPTTQIVQPAQDYLGSTGPRPGDEMRQADGEADLPARSPGGVTLQQEPAAPPPPGIWEMLKQYLGQQQQQSQPQGQMNMQMDTIEQRYPPRNARPPMGPEV